MFYADYFPERYFPPLYFPGAPSVSSPAPSAEVKLDGLRINGLTPTEMGFSTERLDGWADAQNSNRPIVPRPGPYGGFTSTQESVSPRIIRVVGLISGTTIATRDAALDAVVQNLEGQLEIIFDDSPGKVVLAYLSNYTTVGIRPITFVVPDLRVTLEFTAVQSPKLDVYSSIVRCKAATSNGGILVGTAPTLGRIWVHNATNPVFTLSDWRGNEVGSMTLTITLSGSESVVVDLYNQAIYEVDAAEESGWNRNDALLTDGDFLEVLPKYADRTNEIWPKLSVSSGEGWFEFKRFWRS